jgi:hypothetical protein
MPGCTAQVTIDGSHACNAYVAAGDTEIKGFADTTGRRERLRARRCGEPGHADPRVRALQKRGDARVSLHCAAAPGEGREPGAAVQRRGEGAQRAARRTAFGPSLHGVPTAARGALTPRSVPGRAEGAAGVHPRADLRVQVPAH